jgi:hypothetical protein
MPSRTFESTRISGSTLHHSHDHNQHTQNSEHFTGKLEEGFRFDCGRIVRNIKKTKTQRINKNQDKEIVMLC